VRVLVLSSVFPNPAQPALGVFVRERMLRVARRCDLEVVAPVPWFPHVNGVARPHVRAIPAVERQGPLTVWHPRFLSVPRYLKALDGAGYAASLLPFLARLRRRFAFDLIDAHFAYPDGVAAALLGRALGCPVTITLRGSIVRLATYASHRPQIRWALERATGLMAVSQSLRHAAVELGIRPERITVVPNGVDAERFRPGDRAAARLALGLPPEATVVLTVGGVYEDKGQHAILEILPALVARDPRLLYVVLGGFRRDGYRRRLDGLVAAGELAGHVRFVGPRPHEELPDWYRAADLFCLPTRSEGWANVLLEAMACGVPVVTTRVGGNGEIVTSDRYGRLVPHGDATALRDAVLEALDARWDRTAIVAHARTHSWDGAAARVLDRFRDVLAGAPPGAAPARVAAGAGGASMARHRTGSGGGPAARRRGSAGGGAAVGDSRPGAGGGACRLDS
jgi:glycosyltransferase involved in cell wall biosynthesis